MLTEALFTIVKTRKQPECSPTEGQGQMWYTPKGKLRSHKKGPTMPLTATWTGLESVTLSEASQTEEDKFHYDIAYMWNLKKGTNEFIKQSYRCRKQTNGYQGRVRGGINWKTETDIYIVLYIK